MPTRIAFTVATKIDSRTILDAGGAESLLGKGDMLYSPQGSTELMRIHGAFMTDNEVGRVVDDWKARGKPNYIDGILDGDEEENGAERTGDRSGEIDDLFDEVVEFVVSTGTTSISAIQRRSAWVSTVPLTLWNSWKNKALFPPHKTASVKCWRAERIIRINRFF